MVASTSNFPMLDQWQVIQVTGKDAAKFLQGQLTINIDQLVPSKASLSGYCNLKGRLHGVFYVLGCEDGYQLIMPSAIAPHMQKTLKQYAMFSKVNIALAQVCLYGLSHATQSDWTVQKSNTMTMINVPHHRVLIISTESLTALPLANATPLDNAAWSAGDIEAGLPFIYEQTIETLLPHHVNGKALGMLSFDKGCYLGQEIIARMEYKGQIKKHLVRATINASELAPPGTQVYAQEDKIAGTILHSANAQASQALLICLDDQFAKDQLHLNFSGHIPINSITDIS